MIRALATILTLVVSIAPALSQSQFWRDDFERRPERYVPRYYAPWSPYGSPQYRPLAVPRAASTSKPLPRMPEDIHYRGKLILVLLETQQYCVYLDGRVAEHAATRTEMCGPVSTGGHHRDPGVRRTDYRTQPTDPTKGPHTIEYMHPRHVSREFPVWPDGRRGGAVMPYAMFIDRKRGYALHAGDISERYASHGCVRLPPAHAKILYYEFAGPTVDVIIAKNMQHFREVWEEKRMSAE